MLNESTLSKPNCTRMVQKAVPRLRDPTFWRQIRLHETGDQPVYETIFSQINPDSYNIINTFWRLAPCFCGELCQWQLAVFWAARVSHIARRVLCCCLVGALLMDLEQHIMGSTHSTSLIRSWLPDGYSQSFRSYVFGPSGFWTMAPLR